jgi:segregation and condensation protein B
MDLDRHELLGPEMNLEWFEAAIANLQARYARFSHGIELAEIAHGYQFRTKPIRAPLAKKLAKIQTQRLSTGAMETLAIVAYKQPVLKDDVDKIRGVDSSHFIRGLLDKKLIKISGRSELPGRPMVYATTNEFLEIFSLKSLDALPPLKELESMIPGSQSGNPDDGDPRVKKLRELVASMNSDKSVSLLYDPKEDEKFLTEIRERVKSIEIVTPTLQAQAAEDKAAALSQINHKWIKQSHRFPFDTSFSPYCTFGTEYMSVEQNGGNIGPNGGKINFSLPVYGDFFVDFLFNTHWSNIYADAGYLADLPVGLNNKAGDAGSLDMLYTTMGTYANATFTVNGETRTHWNSTDRTYYTVEYRYWDALTSKYVQHDSTVGSNKKYTTKY